MNKKLDWYSIKAAAGAAEIFLYGDIGENWDGETVTARKFIDDLAAVQTKELLIRVNSFGGSVTDGLAIYSAIKRHPATVEVAIDGIAASVASLIAMAGDKVTAAANALVMVHAPWAGVMGNSTDMREMADTLDKHAEAMVAAYARTGQPSKEILSLLSDGKDHWFTAPEALNAGFIDEITEEVALAAHFDLSRYGTIPHKATAMTENTVENKTQTELASRAMKERNQALQELHDFASEASAKSVVVAALVDPAVPIEQVRNAVFDIVEQNQRPLGSAPAFGSDYPLEREENLTRVKYGANAHHAEFKAAAADALLLRGGVAIAKPHAAARDLRGMPIVQMAERVLSMSGRRVQKPGFNPHATIKAAMTTSDFPLLLANTANKSLMMGYEDEPASHRIWTREVETNDFKPVSRIAVSEAPELELIPEGGEYKTGALSERSESYALKTYGKLLKLTRQALINDDLSAFTRIPQAFGQAAARLEADHVYNLLVTNPNMSDGTALFHADHANLMTGAALSVISLGAAKAAMRKQRGIAGLGVLNITPKYLIVPAVLETTAEVLLTSMVDPSAQNDTANLGWIRSLELVTDARLDDDSETAWYLASSPNQIDTVEVMHLTGQRGVFTDESSDFTTDAVSLKARLDFATQVIDWVGLVKNPGA
ncbi:MAG: Clp protease ClpP [Rhodobacteraceae bacterium]|nr:Clp protease ClpP [Paracoccaceae bacterium]